MRSFRRASVVIVFGCLLIHSAAFAQQGGSSIRGRVTDEQNAVLPGAAVIVTHEESGLFRETVTGSDGTFLVQGIVPGPYKITVELSGFSRLLQEHLVLRVGSTLQVDLMLKVGSLAENLTVTAAAPQVGLTSAQVGGNVSSTELTELPSATRNFTGLVALLPGVQYNAAADGNSEQWGSRSFA
jgi:hypothetical protein